MYTLSLAQWLESMRPSTNTPAGTGEAQGKRDQLIEEGTLLLGGGLFVLLSV